MIQKVQTKLTIDGYSVQKVKETRNIVFYQADSRELIFVTEKDSGIVLASIEADGDECASIEITGML